MKRWLATLVLLVMSFSIATSAVCEAPERPQVLYFYENYCGSCRPEEDFASEFLALTGAPLSDYRFSHYNVVHEAEKKLFHTTMDAHDIAEADRRLPTVLVDGVVYAGTAEIQTALPVAFLEASDSLDSLVYYLYVPFCESCAKAKQTLDELPESVELTRGAATFVSPVVVRQVDISAEPGLAQALFDEYGVSEDDRLVPIVFFGDTYLQGAELIAGQLLARICMGQAVGMKVGVDE